jgi:hypothetical protein
MPKQYERMRDRFKREGLSDKEAKRRAAAIYNSRPENKSHPVTYKRKGKGKQH